MSTGIDQMETQEFQVETGAELSVDNVSGCVDIRAGADGTIRMTATKHGSDSACENTRIEASQDGDRVIIRTRSDSSGTFGFNRKCSVDYEISVPPGCKVDVRVVSAEISVMGTHAPVSIKSVSGDVEIEDVSGTCVLTTVSGDSTARRVEGTLTLHTTSGDAHLRESRIDSFNVHSVSGDVDVESPLVAGAQYHGKTVSGDLTLTVPGETGATIQMKTVSGEVNSEIPAQVIRAGRRHWQGVIGGGGADVELTSVSGDLRIIASSPPGIESEPPVAAVRAEPAEPEAHAAEVSDVLRALEQGEIGVEDAMARIKAVR